MVLAILPGLLPLASGARAPVQLRFPEKFMTGAAVALAVVGAKLWDRVRSDRRAPWWPVGIALTLGIGAALLRGEAVLRAPLAQASAHWLLGAIALFALARYGRQRGMAIAAMALIVTELLWATRGIPKTMPRSILETAPPSAVALARLDPHRNFRLLLLADYVGHSPADFASREWERWARMSDYRAALWSVPVVFNFDFDRSDLFRSAEGRRLFFRRAGGAGGSPSFASYLAGFSGRFVLRYKDQAPLSGTAAVWAAGDLAIDENRLPVSPRWALASRWRETPGLAASEAVLRDLADPGIAVLETGRHAASDGSGGALEVLAESPSRVELSVTTAAPGWILSARSYSKWRRITLDGAPVVAVPNRVALTALAVPPGRHQVLWEERVPGGAFGPAATLAGLVTIAVRLRRRRLGARSRSGSPGRSKKAEVEDTGARNLLAPLDV